MERCTPLEIQVNPNATVTFLASVNESLVMSCNLNGTYVYAYLVQTMCSRVTPTYVGMCKLVYMSPYICVLQEMPVH